MNSLYDNNVFNKVLKKYPEIVSPVFSTKEPKHGIFHHILTKGPPVCSKARRLPPEKLIIAKKEFKKMEDL